MDTEGLIIYAVMYLLIKIGLNFANSKIQLKGWVVVLFANALTFLNMFAFILSTDTKPDRSFVVMAMFFLAGTMLGEKIYPVKTSSNTTHRSRNPTKVTKPQDEASVIADLKNQEKNNS